jgi:predicted hydrocarbon binding protein
MMTNALTPIAPSGFFYPNSIARITFLSVEKLLGKETSAAVLRSGGLDRYIDAIPPMNLSHQFDFAEFSMLIAAVDAHGQATGQRDLGERVGRGTYKMGLEQFGGVATLGGVLLGMRKGDELPHVRVGLQAMAGIFSTFSDQKTEVIERQDRIEYRLLRCPICWSRRAESPICQMGIGLLTEGLLWLTGHHARIEEISCHAMGDADCTYAIFKDSFN